MKKLIDLDADIETFFKDYKESHNVNVEAFIRSAIKEKILRVKTELKLNENVNSK